jgi:serine/threonine-protein kinase
MGHVYKAIDTSVKDKIALKVLPPDMAADRDALERFSREVQLARRITHRNVCRLFDLGTSDGIHYLTMEFVPGEDLKRLMRKVGALGAGKIVRIARDLCDGLAEAHRLGIVHRDLKPQNIMVDEDGNAKILDFGIARSVRSTSLTAPGVLIGTPQYMSPEQVDGEDVDPRADLYALGIILYEMATRRCRWPTSRSTTCWRIRGR